MNGKDWDKIEALFGCKGQKLMLKGKVHKYGAKGLKGAKPLLILHLPLMIGIYIHIMERGIKGVRLIKNPKSHEGS